MLRTLRAISLILFLLSCSLSAQSPSVPYAQFFGPDFDNVSVDRAYPGSWPSIRKVDFRDFKLVVFDQTGKQESVLVLKDGRRKWKEKGEMDEAALERLRGSGWFVYRVIDGSVRFMCSWATTAAAIEELVEALDQAA